MFDLGSVTDPKPLLTVKLVTLEPIGTTPAGLLDSPDAHHVYKLFRKPMKGDEGVDLTVLWVPVTPAALDWIGFRYPIHTFRDDGRVLVVLAKTTGQSASTLDALERGIRERFSALGVNGDDLTAERQHHRLFRKVDDGRGLVGRAEIGHAHKPRPMCHVSGKS